MVKSEDVKANANEALREMIRKAHELDKILQYPYPITEKRFNEARSILGEIRSYLGVLDHIITELLESKE